MHEILKRYWGYEHFRPLQEEIIRSVLGGRDTLALMPTGGGKSLCFQVPALMREGLCLVITPLISLMKDQVERLKRQGIPALALHAGMQYREVEKTLRNALYGNFKFLYLSPERLQTALFLEYAASLPVNLIAVDEAHCISQWGYDFRPAYLRIAALREHFPGVPMLALTATATPRVREDILEKLRLRDPALFVKSFVRDNLSYSVLQVQSKIGKVAEILNRVPGSSIVFCGSRRVTVEIAARLRALHIPADFYHAGLPPEERSRRQEAWIQGKVRTMVCTNAFGMGIDKADVRTVIHYDVPDSLEAYYQEAGRAGRDGKRSYAVLLCRGGEAETLQKRIALKYPPLDEIRRVYAAIVNYLQSPAGTGEGRYYDFDMTDFCRRFSVPAALAYHVLKILEQEEVLLLSESVFLPSRVCFTADRAALEQFERDFPRRDPLVKSLLRNYEGILDNYVAVNEKELGRLTRTPAPAVREALLGMRRYGLLDYEPSRNSPRLLLLQDRVISGDLWIDMVRLGQRKKVYAEQVAAVTRYLSGRDVCRSRQLVGYFGEEGSADCGICDVCAAKRRREPPFAFEKISRAVRSLLEGRRLAAEELVGELSSFEAGQVITAVRFLLDEGVLLLDEQQRLSLKK